MQEASKNIDENKVFAFLKKHFIVMLLSAVTPIWLFVKEAVSESADKKFKSKVEQVVVQDLKLHFDTTIDNRFQYNLNKSLNDPLIWYDALSTNYVSEYADNKVTSIRHELEAKLIEMDSIQKNMLESIGRNLGIRNEDVIPLFEEIMNDYIKKRETRRITAPF